MNNNIKRNHRELFPEPTISNIFYLNKGHGWGMSICAALFLPRQNDFVLLVEQLAALVFSPRPHLTSAFYIIASHVCVDG